MSYVFSSRERQMLQGMPKELRPIAAGLKAFLNTPIEQGVATAAYQAAREAQAMGYSTDEAIAIIQSAGGPQAQPKSSFPYWIIGVGIVAAGATYYMTRRKS